MAEKIAFVPLHPLKELYKKDSEEYRLWCEHLWEEMISEQWGLGNELGHEGPKLSMDEVEPVSLGKDVYNFISYGGEDYFEKIREQVYKKKGTEEYFVIYKEEFLDFV